jgi:hypothetical protein
MTVRSKAGGKYRFLCAPWLKSAPGVISAVITDAATSGAENSFTAVGGPTIADRDRLRITASAVPAHIGAVAEVKGFVGGDVTKPITGPWRAATSLGYGAAATEINPSAGDSFAVETPQTTITGWTMNWIGVGGGDGIGFPYIQDAYMAQGSKLGAWRFKTTEKPSENDGHILAQHCRFDPTGPNDDFSASEWWFRGCDFRKGVILSGFGTFQGFDSCMIRGRMTTDTCAGIWVNSNCFDSAQDIAFSVGPGCIWLGAQGRVCFSRCTGQGIVLHAGGEIIGGSCLFWSPAASSAPGSRNPLTDAYYGHGRTYTSLIGGWQLGYFRCLSGTPIKLGGAAATFPCWSAAYQCGVVQEA